MKRMVGVLAILGAAVVVPTAFGQGSVNLNVQPAVGAASQIEPVAASDITLGAGQVRVSTRSVAEGNPFNGTQLLAPPSPVFQVKIHVPQEASRAPEGYEASIHFEATLSEKTLGTGGNVAPGECPHLGQWVRLFKKSGDASWSPLGGGRSRGVWHPGVLPNCTLEPLQGFIPIPLRPAPGRGAPEDVYLVQTVAFFTNVFGFETMMFPPLPGVPFGAWTGAGSHPVPMRITASHGAVAPPSPR